MALLFEDRDRQVVPRWRTFAAAIQFGEVAPLTPLKSDAVDPKTLDPLIEDWQREPSPSVAADLVSAAFAAGVPEVASDAASFVLRDDRLPESARRLARVVLGLQPEETESVPLVADIREAVRRSRQRLKSYPINPVRWTNLSLMFTILGEESKARRSMTTALKLAPENRFVLRAASRLFLHQGELDRAHGVLSNSSLIKSDPWILAGEIAISQLRHKSSKHLKAASRILTSDSLPNFHVSELAGALATIEERWGSSKIARRYCDKSLLDPSENAIAQVAWLKRTAGHEGWEPPKQVRHPSSEAAAWFAHANGQWEAARAATNAWQDEQPFSSRPALFAAYLESVINDDPVESEAILRRTLKSNRNDVTIYNNLAFALAKQGKCVEANRLLSAGWKLATDQRQHAFLTATQGLIAFREGRPDVGRNLYIDAMSLAKEDKPLVALAALYLALEELRSKTEFAPSFEMAAREILKTYKPHFRALFEKKLEKARAFQLRES